ncbi:MAG: hypothetical protein KIT14_02635 [bacterium]|nr:hypothetical protein [bacterium]
MSAARGASPRRRDAASSGSPTAQGLRARLGAFDGEPAAAILRLADLPASTGAVLGEVETAARAGGTAVRCLAHAASGVVRVAVARAEHVAPLVARLRPAAERRGGTCVVHRAEPAAAADLDRWGDPGDGLALMRGVKAAFDPDGIFAPGRFVGGL